MAPVKKFELAILFFFMFHAALYAQFGDNWDRAVEKGEEAVPRIEEIRDRQTRSYSSDHDYVGEEQKSARERRVEEKREEQFRRDQEKYDQEQRDQEFRQQQENKRNASVIYKDLEYTSSDLHAIVSKYKNYYEEQSRKELIAGGVAATEKMAREFIQENSKQGTEFRKDINTLITELDQVWKENTDKDNLERQLRELSDGIGKIVPEEASAFSYGLLNSMYDSYTSTFFLLKDFYLKKETWNYLAGFSFYGDLFRLSKEEHQEVWKPILASYAENIGNSLFFFLHGTSGQRGYAAWHLYGLAKTTRVYSRQVSHAYFNRAAVDFRNPSQLSKAISGSGSLNLSPENKIQQAFLNVEKGKELKGILKPLLPPVQTKKEPLK